MKDATALKAIEPIIEMLEKGEVPPWTRAYSMNLQGPINASTGREYFGANRFLLMMATMIKGDPRFLGYGQAKNLGGYVKKGAKGFTICSPIIKKDEDTGEKGIVGFRGARVFSIKDCEGLDESKIVQLEVKENKNDPIKSVEEFIAMHDIDIQTGIAPCYIPKLDQIQMPPLANYETSEAFYSSLLHEIGHWTGHESRLDRLESTRFGSDPYCREELVAEMFRFFMRAELGFETEQEVTRTVSYFQGWVEKLKAEPTILFSAAKSAETAIKWYKENAKTAQSVAVAV